MVLFISCRNSVLCNGLSLKSLAETLLNFPLDKSLLLRCSNWDAENLTEDQVPVIRELVLVFNASTRQRGLKADLLSSDTQDSNVHAA